VAEECLAPPKKKKRRLSGGMRKSGKIGRKVGGGTIV